MSIEALVRQAEEALTAPGFVTIRNRCKQWVREVVQRTYGHQYDNVVSGDDANEMGRRMQAAGYDTSDRPRAGDVVVRMFEPDGHTGIVVTGNRVAENSTVHWKLHPGDARGTRLLGAWGVPNVIGRLPEAATHWSLDIGQVAAVCTLYTARGVTYAPVKRFCEKTVELLHVVADLTWDNAAKVASVNGKALTTVLVAGKAYAPTRELAGATGLQVDHAAGTRTIAVW